MKALRKSKGLQHSESDAAARKVASELCRSLDAAFAQPQPRGAEVAPTKQIGDRELLRRLCNFADLLSPTSEDAFRSMLRGMEHGAKDCLTPTQRDWAEHEYEDRVADRYVDEPTSAQSDKSKPKALYWWERPENHPTRPPKKATT